MNYVVWLKKCPFLFKFTHKFSFDPKLLIQIFFTQIYMLHDFSFAALKSHINYSNKPYPNSKLSLNYWSCSRSHTLGNADSFLTLSAMKNNSGHEEKHSRKQFSGLLSDEVSAVTGNWQVIVIRTARCKCKWSIFKIILRASPLYTI